MAGHRPERVQSLIVEELGKIILNNVEFEDCLVTISKVDVDAKLERGIVGISVIPSEKTEYAVKILERNRNHLQYLLMKKMNIKPMPKIFFRADYGLQKAAEIEKIVIENEDKF